MPQATARTGNGTHLWVIVSSVSFLLLYRTTGLQPTVFADEYTYSKFARLLALDEVSIPGYLYFFAYGSTNLCGEAFLACARVLNIFFLVAAAPFIYLIGRKVSGERSALVIALLSILGPINSYTAYFMPESLYFFTFWVFTYFAFSLEREHSLSRWALVGLLFGISALVKPHALFLLPALAIYFLVVQFHFAGGRLRYVYFGRYLGLFASAISTKFAIGYLLAGVAGLTLFGAAYTSIAVSSMKGMEHYLHLMGLAARNLFGHAISLSLLFAVPIAGLLARVGTLRPHDDKERIQANIAQYTLLVLALLLCVVVAFTASVSGSGPYESNARLHMRYYNFAFPLLLLVAGSYLEVGSGGPSRGYRALVAIPLGAAICYALWTKLAPYAPSLVDNPELRGFTYNPTAFYVLGGIALLSLALWVYRTRVGAASFIFLFMPLTVCSSTFYVNQELRHRLVPDVFDRAGMFTKRYLPPEDIAKLVVIGSDPAGLFRTLFHLDHRDATYVALAQDESYDIRKLPADKDWILLVGDHPLSGDVFFKLTVNGFTLARAKGPDTIDFRKTSWPGLLSTARGLSAAERWGAWSVGDVVTLEFSAPLPERFSVHLKAQAFGRNVGRRLVARVGSYVVDFTLGAHAEERRLDFVNPESSRVLSFHIPDPVSPKALGLSSDERRLGIGFIEMKIESRSG